MNTRAIFPILVFLVHCSSGATDVGDATPFDDGGTADAPNESEPILEEPDAQMDDAAIDDASTPAIVSGPQNTLAILVNLADKQVVATAAQVQASLFTAPTSVDAFYQTASHGAVSFTGKVVGPFDITDVSSACDFAQWDIDARAAAVAHGVSLAGFQHLVFVLSPGTACKYSAITNSALSPTQVNIFGGYGSPTLAHELGHAMGMTHASTVAQQYGDYSDVMGNTTSYATENGPHKVEMGWTKSATVPTCSGCAYTIENLEATPTQTQVLLVPRKSAGDYYYVSYRVATGVDAKIPAPYANAVNVHFWSGKGGPSKACAPDATYVQGACNTYFVQALTDGQSFVDAANGVTIQQKSHDATSATLSITTP